MPFVSCSHRNHPRPANVFLSINIVVSLALLLSNPFIAFGTNPRRVSVRLNQITMLALARLWL
jgi:hypothetical protein